MCREPGQPPPNREEDPQRSNLWGGGGSSPPSSPDHNGADSDGFSTASEAVGGRRRHRRWRNEKRLAPTCLDMPIFKTIDLNADIMYTSHLPQPPGVPRQVGVLARAGLNHPPMQSVEVDGHRIQENMGL